MWRYGHFPHYSWMGSFFPGGIVSMLIWVLIILALVYLGIKLFRALSSEKIKQNRDNLDSFEILKMRYARGEISHEDYLTMKETLKQSG
jgi:putative membrane protein